MTEHRPASKCFLLIIILLGLASTGVFLFSGDKKEDNKKTIEKADEDAPKSEIETLSKKELQLKACGESEINFSAKTEKGKHPEAEPIAGQAIVYVLRPTMMGNKVQTKLAMDGTWLGANRGNNYFYFTAAPGEHFFCSRAENRSVLQLKLEPDKTYYLQQQIKMGFMKAANKLVLMTEEEGINKLKKCNLSVFEEKH